MDLCVTADHESTFFGSECFDVGYKVVTKEQLTALTPYTSMKIKPKQKVMQKTQQSTVMVMSQTDSDATVEYNFQQPRPNNNQGRPGEQANFVDNFLNFFLGTDNK